MVTMVTMVTTRMPTLTNRPRLASVRTEASCCGNSGARDASAGRPAQMDCRDGPGGAARLRDRDARDLSRERRDARGGGLHAKAYTLAHNLQNRGLGR